MKAQANPQSYIALLLFVIGLSLIVYILMLPPADRAELLEQNRTRTTPDKSLITIIMKKEPGTLSNLPDLELKKELPGFNLFLRTDTSSIITLDSVYVKKSLFEEQQRNVSFSIKNFETMDNFVLSFNAPRRRGILTIMLNGNILTSNELTTESPSPIRLPKDWLKKENNLVFKVNGPGMEFWNYNEYLLQNMKITADITDTSGKENKQVFVVSEQEKTNLESFTLSFVAECKATDVSPIQIYLNKRQIYSSIPECGILTKVSPQDSSRIKSGENILEFFIEKGFYEIYNLEATLKLKKPIFPTYYFYLDKEVYDKIKSDKADLNVTILFSNSVDRKKGVVYVNDYWMEIETYEASYTRNIDQFVREGNNAIEIRPKSDKLEITELKVLMAE